MMGRQGLTPCQPARCAPENAEAKGLRRRDLRHSITGCAVACSGHEWHVLLQEPPTTMHESTTGGGKDAGMGWWQ